MKDCLLIIDVQVGFLTKETMHIPNRIVCLAEKTKFEHVVATKFINSENTPHYKIIGWDEMMEESAQCGVYADAQKPWQKKCAIILKKITMKSKTLYYLIVSAGNSHHYRNHGQTKGGNVHWGSQN